jgi:hypothetical protein
MARLALLLVFIGFSLQSFGAVSANYRRPANIVGPTDDRGMIRSIGAKYLSPVEATQLRNNVGYVHCPGNPKDKLVKGAPIHDGYLGRITATGFLVGKDVVVTAAHAFANFYGMLRPAIGSCYFQTQGDRSKRYMVRPETLRHGFLWREKDKNDDYAVIQLTEVVENAQPLTVFSSPEPLSVDTIIYPVVAFRPEGKKLGDLEYEPLIQECLVKKLNLGTAHRPSTFYSNCDNERGGSGGPNLVRVQGRLIVTGIFYATGPIEADFLPYSEGLVLGRNGAQVFSHTRSVHVDSAFLRYIEEALRESRKRAGAASVGDGVIGATVPGARAIAPSGAAVPVNTAPSASATSRSNPQVRSTGNLGFAD